VIYEANVPGNIHNYGSSHASVTDAPIDLVDPI
jgi:hypothetical protein